MGEMGVSSFPHQPCLLKTRLNVGTKENEVLTSLTPKVNVQSEPIKARQFRGWMAHKRDLWLLGWGSASPNIAHGSLECHCEHKKF